jgi:hypothetical protein
MFQEPPYVNENAHFAQHAPSTIVYTSKATLDTNAGTKLRLPRGGQITRVAAKVQTTGATDLTFNIYIDTISVTDSDVRILAGETVARFIIVKRPNFNQDSVFQVQLSATGGATGPLVVSVEYLPGF